ncbi:MAG: YicC/YloC family endoribonuclease [Bryobacteraceae bacterium]
MTGFARIRQQTSLGELTVSLRTVNHRALDFHFHQSSEFQIFENAARALLKQEIGRGHVEVRISLARAGGNGAVEYNRQVVARYVAAFREAAAEFGVIAEPDLDAAFRLPGAFVLDGAETEIDQAYQSELLAALSRCVEELNTFRAREGAELAEMLRKETRQIQTQATAMRAIREKAAPEMQKRLLERLQNLLGDVNVDARRLAEEAAILADRSDVEEELARLEIHATQLLEMLEQGGETGKKLDFLLQEMNRETNTILSKTSGIGETGLTMSDLALATKANIERIREQALNIE